MPEAAYAKRIITAFFDTHEQAELAIQDLETAGFPHENIRLISPGSDPEAMNARSYPKESKGFWEGLKDLFMPDEDRHTYSEGLRRGGYLVSVTAPSDADYEHAAAILQDADGSVDIDERQSAWQAEGWQGYDDTHQRSAVGRPGDQEVIPVTEEALKIGKREVDQGRVRVRSYTVETPVQEDVSLREEHVSIERRPVDRPVTGRDDIFRDRTIEMDERSEEAVISKETRVKEEIVLNKDVEQRTQRVADTVRRTEVEVEDNRGESSKRRS